MSRVAFFALTILLLAGPVLAEEMVVQLKSGNALRIQYTGNIQGVSLEGKTDAIEAMNLQPGKAGGQGKSQQVASKETPAAMPGEAKSRADGWFRFRWAEPKTED